MSIIRRILPVAALGPLAFAVAATAAPRHVLVEKFGYPL